MKEKHPLVNLAERQEWLEPLSEKSDALVNSTASEATKDTLVNNRLLGHKRHPTITDVPFGSWTVTLVSDILEAVGQEQFSVSGDTALGVGLAASLIASLGGLADLSETHAPADRRLGAMHGLLQGAASLLYGTSFVARRTSQRTLGRILSFTGYGTVIAASLLAAELAKRRECAEAE